MTDKKQKKWFLSTLIMSIGILLSILIIMVVVDPYFHYHAPLNGVSYRLYSERYMNNGIAKHFEYDAVISGSSMNQNFKTSVMDSLFGTSSIKIPFSGAGFREIKNAIKVALESGNEVKYVLWGLDYNGINRAHYYEGYEEYPDYLYDKNIWNDVSYVFNKTILFEGLINTFLWNLSGKETTTFDEYSTWDGGFGWESISKTYQRSSDIFPMEEMTDIEEDRVKENIEKNVVELAKAYPDTQFLIFYTPYSALYWESLYREGKLIKQVQMEQAVTELMLECDNIKLFNFCQETEITGDVNNYRDKEHYVAEINDLIMKWIAEGRGLVTKENYQELIEWEKQYYMNYDYDSLYDGYEQYMNPEKQNNQ